MGTLGTATLALRPRHSHASAWEREFFSLSPTLHHYQSLKAEGGGTCPEASVEAVEVAALHAKPGGIIWFSTDASPYPEEWTMVVNQ